LEQPASEAGRLAVLGIIEEETYYAVNTDSRNGPFPKKAVLDERVIAKGKREEHKPVIKKWTAVRCFLNRQSDDCF
jgi:hypothetical protein